MYTKEEIRQEAEYLNLNSEQVIQIKNATEKYECSILEAIQLVLEDEY